MKTSKWSILRIAVLTALLCGLLDVIWNLTREPVRVVDWRYVVLPLAATSLTALVSYLFCYPFARVLTRAFRADARWLPVTVAAWHVLIVLALPLAWTVGSNPRVAADGVVLILLGLALGACSYQIVEWLGRTVTAAGLLDEARGLLLGLPFLLLSSLAFVLVLVFWVRLGETWPTIGSAAIYLILMSGQAWFFWRRGHRHAGWLLSVPAVAIGAVVIVALLPVPSASGGGNSESERPIRRVVLLTIDTLRADQLGVYGAGGRPSANIDALAADGIVFEKAIAPSPWTLPAMVSILTGVSPFFHQTGLERPRLPAKLRTLAQPMQAAGYRTAALGRNIHLRERSGLSRGFDYYRFFPRSCIRSALGTRLLRQALPALLQVDATTSDLAALTREWIEAHAREDFFLWVHIFDPHLPYAPPRRYMPERNPGDLPSSFERVREVRGGHLHPGTAEREWIRSLYQREIRYVDDEIGSLVGLLKRLDLYDDSLIVVTSDHGEEFWEHGRFEHGHSLYEELLHVPLIVKPPAALLSDLTRRRISRRVSTQSIPATVLALCDLPPPGPNGIAPSLMPNWISTETDADSTVFSTGLYYYEDGVAAYDGDVKYIRWLDSGVEELYDLTEDPQERWNLARSRADLLRRGRKLVQAHQEQQSSLAKELGIGPDPAEIEHDAETLEELRSLGYVH
ncbi:MAG: sulfatase [Planctomycetota bacterium]